MLGPSLGTSTILWENALPVLAARYRVVAWDLPGHGSSPAATEPFTVADLADAVAAEIRALGAGRVLYAGVSLGGATGLELGLRHPDLVVGARDRRIRCAARRTERVARARGEVRSQSTSVLIIPSAQRWFAPGLDRARARPVGPAAARPADADDESYALCCEALAAYDVRERLGEIGVPVLALWGEHDAVAPEAKAARDRRRSACDGRAEMIAGAAHLPPAEAPAATAAALLAFFESGASAKETRMAESAPRPRARDSPTASGTSRG